MTHKDTADLVLSVGGRDHPMQFSKSLQPFEAVQEEHGKGNTGKQAKNGGGTSRIPHNPCPLERIVLMCPYFAVPDGHQSSRAVLDHNDVVT